MGMKTWKHFNYQCAYCGSDAEVLTDAPEPGFAGDGDEARCVECKCPGSVVVSEEPFATVNWHDEPDCDCEWCKAHPV